MSTYTQANRPLAVTTPLGPDVLLLTGLEGSEGISELFRFELRLLADRKTPVPFEKVLGQDVTVELELPGGAKRYVNGIVSVLEQGRRDEEFTHFRAELVPRMWLLTRKVRSRVFQHLTVPEILRVLFAGLVTKIEISAAYEPRDYCVQYRESDLAFASRLMEEEGIRYYFRHGMGSHQLVVTDDATEHPDLPVQSDVAYEELPPGGELREMRVTSWHKLQQVRSDTCTLRDHCFEMPGQSLEAQQTVLESVGVGKATHRLRAVGDTLEVYDYPGGYARRFDGVDANGAVQAGELGKIFVDKERTVRLRMELEEMLGLSISGTSYCRHFTPGFAFTLSRHFDADDRYLITRVEHQASLEGDYRTGGTMPFSYRNSFRCLPAVLAYRPPLATPRPVIAGSQTATVVAPSGEELFCDRYGRVKVLFHWDREGRRDPSASCWIRVAQPWAGKGWGAFFWPRAGNEVVVTFEDGDPDQPLVVGSVYNAENMPPFALPLRSELSGVKSASIRGHASQHFNGVLFSDAKGDEHLSIHSERTLTFNSEWDKEFHAGRNRHESVSNVMTSMIGGLPSAGGGGGAGSSGNFVAEDQPYSLKADQVSIVADAPLTAIPPQSVISLLAAGENGLGVVNVRGALGVRVTAGPPVVLPTYSPLTNGVEIAVMPPQTITLQQGLVPPAGQKVELGLTGITVNAGGLPVTIESATLIELKVAGGVAKIVLSPEGVDITGPTVRVTGMVDTAIVGTRTTVTAAAELALRAPLTRIDPA